MQSRGTIRCNLNLNKKTVSRVDAYASTYSLSRTKAVEEILQLGLDAEISGIDSTLAMQSKVKTELNALRGLVAASIDAADTAASTSLLLAFQNGEIEADKIAELYSKARRYTKENMKEMKKEKETKKNG